MKPPCQMFVLFWYLQALQMENNILDIIFCFRKKKCYLKHNKCDRAISLESQQRMPVHGKCMERTTTPQRCSSDSR